jgi:hypothetical protein
VTFGAGSQAWEAASRRLENEARESHLFSETRGYQWRELQHLFTSSERTFIETNPRLFGYGLWKPRVIKKFLSDFPEIDYVLYLDAGCELNINNKSKKTFSYYCDLLSANDYLAFALEHPEEKWTKKDLFDYMGACGDEFLGPQIQSAVIFMSREFASTFCADWTRIMTTRDFKLLDDSPSGQDELTIFIEHRHDQSIFSLLIKRQRVSSFISEENLYFPPFWENGDAYPIWTTRNKNLIPLKKRYFKWRFLILVYRMFGKNLRKYIDN